MSEFEIKKRTAFIKEQEVNYIYPFRLETKKENIFSFPVPEYIQNRGEDDINN